MSIQTPRTRSAADAWSRHASIVARMLLVAMLWSTATAQAARTAAKPKGKAETAEANKAAEHQQAPVPTTVYRCRQPDGQMLYTQHACPAAAANKVMQISDARTAEQARHSEHMHARNHKLGQRMQRERQSWARQASRQNKQAKALTLPELEEADDKAAKRKATSRSSKQASSHKTRPDKDDARAPKPLRPADFVARVPGSKAPTAKQRKDKDASTEAPPQS